MKAFSAHRSFSEIDHSGDDGSRVRSPHLCLPTFVSLPSASFFSFPKEIRGILRV